jgi:8-oxo-dGTP diphosphatase
MIPRHGEPWRPRTRYRRRPGVYAVLQRGDDVLLTFQEAPKPEFQLPGGGIDPGEHPLRALGREVREETGWLIARPRRIGAFRRFTYMPEYDLWAEKVCTVYAAFPVRPLGAPTEAGHHAVWMPWRDALDALGNPGDSMLLARALTGRRG